MPMKHSAISPETYSSPRPFTKGVGQSEALTVTESNRLKVLEKTIAQGQAVFVDVGLALAEIRDFKLYKSDYKTFEQYCRARWRFTKQHAYRLIEAAPIAKSHPRVTSERSARELAKVDPSQREEVLEKAAQTGKITGDAIEIAANLLKHKPSVTEKSPSKPAVEPERIPTCANSDEDGTGDYDIDAAIARCSKVLWDEINKCPDDQIVFFKSLVEDTIKPLYEAMDEVMAKITTH